MGVLPDLDKTDDVLGFFFDDAAEPTSSSSSEVLAVHLVPAVDADEEAALLS